MLTEKQNIQFAKNLSLMDEKIAEYELLCKELEDYKTKKIVDLNYLTELKLKFEKNNMAINMINEKLKKLKLVK